MLNSNTGLHNQTRISKPLASFTAIPAIELSVKQLTDIYNQTRMDYIVPMPMSEAKLRGYIYNYDVDLCRSIVVAQKGEPFGLGLLGVRGDKTWITRLGITPKGRGKGVGRAMMTELINNSRKMGASKVILEVIKKNKLARHLFESFGFETLRELLVIRRPPGPVAGTKPDAMSISIGDHQAAEKLLKSRADRPSWVTATRSMLNAGNLSALIVDNSNDWLVYQNSPFQLTRLVVSLNAGSSFDVAVALLKYLHMRHPMQDTAVENLSADDKAWPAYQTMEYITSFVRVEMELSLTSWALDKVGYPAA